MKVYIDNGLGYQDYTQNVVTGSLSIEDSVNVPTLTNLILSPNQNNAFIVPKRSAYIRVVSDIYASGNAGGYGYGKVLSTGFITNQPEVEYLGLSPVLSNFKFQQLSYKLNITSDEWLLNSRSVPYIPAFINQTCGQILAGLAETLAPGFFDVTTHVASGDVVPYFQYSPDKTWSDIAKEFADSLRFRYKVIDRVVYFEPFGDQSLGIRYDEDVPHALFNRNAFPLELQSGVLTVPPVNDALVLGGVEPQTNVENYFVGDGFSSQFRLLHRAFEGATSLLIQDDWTGASFQTNLWDVQDPLNLFSLDINGQAAGALNVLMGAVTGALNTEYILGLNGVELGGALNLQHGQFQFQDNCTGIVGGLYTSTTLTMPNCIAGFQLSNGTVVPSLSGASGIIMQPIFNGAAVGPQVVSQQNHYYVLQTWVNANRWDRYERIYRNLTGSVDYGGNNLPSESTISWVVSDYDTGQYAITPQPLQNTIHPVVTKYTLQAEVLTEFAVYAPINAENLNLTLNYTAIYEPPQGALYVRGLTGATGMQLPLLPQNLGDEIHYQVGFGMNEQVATVLANGDSNYLAFYNDTIPGVGSRIRYQSWAAGQSVARVRDPIAIAAEACVSGDSGVRSAIFTNLSPQPRTSSECELAAAAAIHDREYPQFQGSYTVEVVPYKWESLYNPGMYDYPRSGSYFYVNAPVRSISGQNFVVHSTRTLVTELRDEIMQVSLDYGPDLYLEKLLPNFLERSQNLLAPTESASPPNPVYLSQVGAWYLDTVDTAHIINIQNSSISGNSITLDFGVAAATGFEVRRADLGWGNQSAQQLIGVFTSQVVTLSRITRDSTWYIRMKNGAQYSRFSKALRVDYPMIPSVPTILGADQTRLALDFSGDVRNIYGVELRLPVNVSVTPSGDFLPSYMTYRTQFGAMFLQNGIDMPDIGSMFTPGDLVLVTCDEPLLSGVKLIELAVPFQNIPQSRAHGNYLIAHDNYAPTQQPGQVIVRGGGVPQGAVPATFQLIRTGQLGVNYIDLTGATGNLTASTATISGLASHPFTTGQVIIVSGIQNGQNPLGGLPLNIIATVQTVTATSFTYEVENQFDIADFTFTEGVVAFLPPLTTGTGEIAVLSRRPVFSSSDLIFDLTQPQFAAAVSTIKALSQSIRVPGIEAYFFNLTWDYSDPTLVNAALIVPGVANIAVDPLTKVVSWQTVQGTPTSYNFTVADPVTGVVSVQTDVVSPHYLLADADFYSPRGLFVTPIDANGFGSLGVALNTLSLSGNNIVNNVAYSIGCTFNGVIPTAICMVRVPFEQQVIFPWNFGGSKGVFDKRWASTGVFNITLNNALVGTMTMAGGVAPGFPGNVSFASVGASWVSQTLTCQVGDVLRVVSPVVPDPTGGDIGFVLSSSKSQTIFNQTNTLQLFDGFTLQDRVVLGGIPRMNLSLSDSLNFWQDLTPAESSV